jgi:hypothetical protein
MALGVVFGAGCDDGDDDRSMHAEVSRRAVARREACSIGAPE